MKDLDCAIFETQSLVEILEIEALKLSEYRNHIFARLVPEKWNRCGTPCSVVRR